MKNSIRSGVYEADRVFAACFVSGLVACGLAAPFATADDTSGLGLVLVVAMLLAWRLGGKAAAFWATPIVATVPAALLAEHPLLATATLMAHAVGYLSLVFVAEALEEHWLRQGRLYLGKLSTGFRVRTLSVPSGKIVAQRSTVTSATRP
ncbi:MAG: hypothetical protein KIT11_02315 [Fimbriimonadaceae bacterium]|nr:hypothetical protein [Fimbriimonadaceae bacterium]QYK54797.1 MAG: hypothetical protein KF733_07220 [Fimbriimonadaceae bacterium]